MNLIKTLRKPYLSILLSSLVLFASCSQYEDNNVSEEQFDLNKSVESLKRLDNKLINNSNSRVSNYEVYQSWIQEENLEIPTYNEIGEMINLTPDNSEEYINNNNLISESEKIILSTFSDNINNGLSLNTSLDLLNQELSTLNLSDDQISKWNSFNLSYQILDQIQNENTNSRVRPIFGECADATIGLVFGFAGLVAGTASVGGAALGAAGFIWASASWGAACG